MAAARKPKPNRMTTARPRIGQLVPDTSSEDPVGDALRTGRPRVTAAPPEGSTEEREQVNEEDYQFSTTSNGGPRTKLTEEIIANACRYLAYDGLPVNHACALLYITESTWYTWERRGRNALEGRPESSRPKDEALYSLFYQEIKKAQATYQLNKLRTSLNLRRYAPNWARDLTILERRDRANWGRDTASGNRGVVAPDERFL